MNLRINDILIPLPLSLIISISFSLSLSDSRNSSQEEMGQTPKAQKIKNNNSTFCQKTDSGAKGFVYFFQEFLSKESF